MYCPDCERRLARVGPDTWACFNCAQRYEYTDDGSEKFDGEDMSLDEIAEKYWG